MRNRFFFFFGVYHWEKNDHKNTPASIIFYNGSLQRVDKQKQVLCRQNLASEMLSSNTGTPW